MTGRKIYVVRLSESERDYLSKLTKSGKTNARKLNRAMVLLKADENGLAWTDKEIGIAFDIGTATIERCRKRFVEGGLEAAIEQRPRVEKKLRRKLDGEGEAKLIALVCSDPPKGYQRWTLRLLAKRLVTLEVTEEISHETVRQTLKKINLNLG